MTMKYLVKFVTDTKEILKPKSKDGEKRVCILPISVGQSYHAEERFIATIKALNDFFDECIIVVADTLQRHTLKISGMSEEEAKKQSVKDGAEWFNSQDTQEALSELTIEKKILHWDAFLEDVEFDREYKIVQEAYTKGKESTEKQYRDSADRPAAFTSIVEKTIGSFIGTYIKGEKIRKQKPVVGFSIETAKTACLDYVLEESAVMRLMGKHAGYMAYPVSDSPTNEQVFECIKVLNGQKYPLELIDIKFLQQSNPKKKEKGKQPQKSRREKIEGGGKKNVPQPQAESTAPYDKVFVGSAPFFASGRPSGSNFFPTNNYPNSYNQGPGATMPVPERESDLLFESVDAGVQALRVRFRRLEVDLKLASIRKNEELCRKISFEMKSIQLKLEKLHTELSDESSSFSDDSSPESFNDTANTEFGKDGGRSPSPH